MKNLFSATFFVTIIFAQYTSSVHQEQMTKLAFMVGNWHGSALMMSRTGKHEIPNQTEKVLWQLDKTALLIEGKGFSANGNTVHHALALITWNQRTNQYDFRTALANGRVANATAKFNEKNEFQWFLNTPSGQITYTINYTNGKWLEIGEMEIEGSKRNIFEMELIKE